MSPVAVSIFSRIRARKIGYDTAEHAHAADRFAREIIGFLIVRVARSRRLMGRPFGGSPFSLYQLQRDENRNVILPGVTQRLYVLDSALYVFPFSASSVFPYVPIVCYSYAYGRCRTSHQTTRNHYPTYRWYRYAVETDKSIIL